MKRAYSYVRFSSAEQRKGASLARQTELARAWADEHDYFLDDSLRLTDKAVSAFRGTNATHGKLKAFLDKVDEGLVPKGSVLIVESLDRISRQEVFEALEGFLGILNRGVEIVTLSPRPEHYKRHGLNQLQLIVAIVVLGRAYDESAMKSARLTDTWVRRRAKAAEKPTTSICPAWLRPNEDGSGFEKIPERVKIVRRVYELSLSGLGRTSIAAKLNRERVSSFAPKRPLWSDKSIDVLLSSRAVLGEFQPCRREGRERVPVGPVIRGYYPAVITEQDFYASMAAIIGRVRKRGPQRGSNGNFFTDLLFDVRDGGRFRLVYRGNERCRAKYLVNVNRQRGVGDELPTIPAAAFEDGFLRAVRELKVRDVLPTTETGPDIEVQIAAAEAKLADLDQQLAALKSSATGKNIAAVIDLLASRQAERDATAEQGERLKAERHNPASDTLAETQDLIDLVAKAEGDELDELRERIRSAIRRLVDRIDVLAIDLPGHARKQVFVEINFAAGGSRGIQLLVEKGKLVEATTVKLPVTSAASRFAADDDRELYVTLMTVTTDELERAREEGGQPAVEPVAAPPVVKPRGKVKSKSVADELLALAEGGRRKAR